MTDRILMFLILPLPANTNDVRPFVLSSSSNALRFSYDRSIPPIQFGGNHSFFFSHENTLIRE